MKKGENGFFRIARGSNTCGIGRSAIYLCHKKVCTSSDINGIASYNSINQNCQCGGAGYLGGTNCFQTSCYKLSTVYSQCLSQYGGSKIVVPGILLFSKLFKL